LNLDDVNGDISTMHTIQTFPTMLKLISGTLVGGANYSDIHIDTDVKGILEKLSTINNETTKEMDREKNTHSTKRTNIARIARRVARLKKKQLKKTLHCI
jgi:hypothetical protein